MIDYTQNGASLMPGADDDDPRRRALQQPLQQGTAVQPVQQPTQAPVAQPQSPAPTSPTQPRAPSAGGFSPVSATTFAALQAAGIPRPAPTAIPQAAPTAPPTTPPEQRVPQSTGAPAAGTPVPAGYDPRAFQLSQQDIEQRQGWNYQTPDGRTLSGKSEGMGDAFTSAQEWNAYLASLPNDTARQVARFANPQAYMGNFGTQGAPAAQTGGPLLQSVGSLLGATPGQVTDPRPPQTGPSPVATPQAPNAPTAPGTQSPLGSQISQVLQQLLGSPTAYNSDAMMREFQAGSRGIDDDFSLRRKRLDEEMARRGIYDSTIAAGNLGDLNIGQRSAETELMDRLLTKRADAQDGGIRSALAAAMGYDSDLAGRDFQNRSLSADNERFLQSLGLDRERLGETRRQFDSSLGFDRERYQGDSQFRDKQFSADEQARQDDFLRAWYQLFGGTV
jgi:hypothetical protein